jgi:hypothetical protein
MDVRGLPNFKAGLTVSVGAIDFSGNVPRCTGVPVNGSDLINKTYGDANYHPIGSYVDLSTNQTVGGVKSFTSNLRAIATTGDVFQAFKNSVVGNAGHVLINDLGNLSYFDSTASTIKWRLDTSGNLTVGSIDLSGTLINKTTTAGTYIKSNSNATGYFFANNNGDIGYTDSTAGIGNRWFITAAGVARFISSTNSYKYWEFGGNVFRYWNLGGGGFSILMNGDTGAITTTGSVTTGTVTTTNLNVSGTVNASGAETLFGGDIDTSGNDIYTDVLVASGYVATNLGIDIQNSLNGVIEFTGGAQIIRIGVDTVADTTPDGIVIGNDSTTLGGAIVCGAMCSMTTSGRGTGSVLFGQLCESFGSYSLNLGYNAISVQNGIAIGRGARAGNTVPGNTESIAIGRDSVSGTQAVAIGPSTSALFQDAIAIGKSATSNNAGGVAIGAYSQANGDQAISIGYNSTANFSNAVSIGNGVQAGTTNEFRIGNPSNNILFSQVFYPYEVNPTVYTATPVTIAGAPAYGINILSYAGVQNIILPTITTGMNGITLIFRKVSGIGSNTNITCSTGNQYYPYNSGTVTAAGVNTLFIGGSESVGRVCCLGGITWAVI